MSFKCCFRLKADMTGFTDNPILAQSGQGDCIAEFGREAITGQF